MFTVRPSSRGDLAALDSLFARSYPRLLKADYAPSVLVTALPLISRAQPGLITSGSYFAVEEDDAGLIGAGGWTRAAPGGGRGSGPEDSGHIRHVVTDDRQVRRGVGRALMDHVFATARSAGITRLDCMSTLTAVPFYQAVGFVVLGPMIAALGPGIDFPAMAMRRDI